jgi:low temperature requirement protein LtrA
VTSGTGGLVQSLEDAARATFLELFFDLAFVFAVGALAQQLIHHLNWYGAFQTLVLLLAIGWVWFLTARTRRQPAEVSPPFDRHGDK